MFWLKDKAIELMREFYANFLSGLMQGCCIAFESEGNGFNHLNWLWDILFQ